jgi:hypothetical protein
MQTTSRVGQISAQPSAASAILVSQHWRTRIQMDLRKRLTLGSCGRWAMPSLIIGGGLGQRPLTMTRSKRSRFSKKDLRKYPTFRILEIPLEFTTIRYQIQSITHLNPLRLDSLGSPRKIILGLLATPLFTVSESEDVRYEGHRGKPAHGKQHPGTEYKAKFLQLPYTQYIKRRLIFYKQSPHSVGVRSRRSSARTPPWPRRSKRACSWAGPR